MTREQETTKWQWARFDALPKIVREAFVKAAFPWPIDDICNAYEEGVSAAVLVTAIREWDYKQIQKGSAEHSSFMRKVRDDAGLTVDKNLVTVERNFLQW